MVKNFLIALKIYSRCNKSCIKKSNSKKAKATGDLNGNKIADKITNVSKKSTNNYQIIKLKLTDMIRRTQAKQV